MNVKKIVQALVRFITGKVGGIPVGKLTNKLLPVIKNAAPILTATQVIGDIPGVKQAFTGLYDNLEELESKVWNNTIGKVPGLGDLLKPVQDFGQKARKTTAKIAGLYNNPKWYTNLDAHLTYNIPFGKLEGAGLEFGPENLLSPRASLAIMFTGYNHYSDVESRNRRAAQIMDLTKAIRGLSGQVPYSMGDILWLQDYAAYMINEYGRLKFALRAARYYNLYKNPLPEALINACGFDFEDFIQNRALYTNQLVRLSNFLTNNVPMSGYYIDKIYHSWDAVMPDSNDTKVATYYKTILSVVTPLVPSDGSTNPRYLTDLFRVSDDSFFRNSPSITTYSNYSDGMTYAMNQIYNIASIAALRGDLIGAFGTSVLFVDDDINSIDEIKPNIVAKWDELYLTTIQNASVLDFIPSIINQTDRTSIQTGVPTVKYEVIPIYGDSGLRFSGHIKTTAGADLAGANGIILPPMDGYKPTESVISLGDHSGYISDTFDVNTYKYNMSEGEQLEILQFMAYPVEVKSTLSGNTVYVDVFYQTQPMFILNTVIVSTRSINTSTAYIANASIYDRNTTLRVDKDALALWSQCDYMHKMAYDFDNTGTPVGTSPLWDVNILGTLSKTALNQAMSYTSYSLYGVQAQVTKDKKISSIANIYQIKSR